MEIRKWYIFIGLIGSLFGCKQMDDTYREFIEGGERIYIGKADSLRVLSGHHRMMLQWLAISDQRISKAKAFWNNQSDSIEVPIQKTKGIDTIRVLIDNLEEGDYSVDVICFDDQGNSSIGINRVGSVYGERYIASLLQRPLLEYKLATDSLFLFWGAGDPTIIGVELQLIGASEPPVNVTDYSLSDTTKVALDNAITALNFRTLYKPDSASIDTFYTALDHIAVEN